jgi:hypothetical protein
MTARVQKSLVVSLYPRIGWGLPLRGLENGLTPFGFGVGLSRMISDRQGIGRHACLRSMGGRGD